MSIAAKLMLWLLKYFWKLIVLLSNTFLVSVTATLGFVFTISAIPVAMPMAHSFITKVLSVF